MRDVEGRPGVPARRRSPRPPECLPTPPPPFRSRSSYPALRPPAWLVYALCDSHGQCLSMGQSSRRMSRVSMGMAAVVCSVAVWTAERPAETPRLVHRAPTLTTDAHRSGSTSSPAETTPGRPDGPARCPLGAWDMHRLDWATGTKSERYARHGHRPIRLGYGLGRRNDPSRGGGPGRVNGRERGCGAGPVVSRVRRPRGGRGRAGPWPRCRCRRGRARR